MPLICPECGRESDPPNRFCGICGIRLLSKQTRSITDVMKVESPAPPVVPIEPTRFEPTRFEPTREIASRAEFFRDQPARNEPSHVDPIRQESQAGRAMSEPIAPEAVKAEALREIMARNESVRESASRNDRQKHIKEETPPVAGLSFLGLANESADTPSYLLEDEQSSSHRGRLLILVLVLAALLAAGWYYRQRLSEEAAKLESHPAQPANPNGKVTYSASPVATSGSEVAGAQPNGFVMHETPAVGDASATTVGASSATAKAPEASSSQKPAQPAAAASKAAPAQVADASASSSPAPARKEKTTASATPAVDNGDAAEADAERYLYGNGVPASCTRALQGLTQAANRTNLKADSVLGTMYATGHCVSPNIPTAYRYFAKASHGDPKNAMLTRELQVLWNQMTPEQRLAAQQSN